uniref:Uncharacterized protein n=1 Tax=Podarcis muralis TaxID=64176 RepID=A0A670IUS0_PODMU
HLWAETASVLGTPGLGHKYCKSEFGVDSFVVYSIYAPVLFFVFLQTSLFAHSSRNIIMSVIFSYKGYNWPGLFWVVGVKSDEFICVVLVESIDLDGVLKGVSQEKHLHLGIEGRK